MSKKELPPTEKHLLDVHAVWHDFTKRFKKQIKYGRAFTVKVGNRKKKMYRYREEWKWSGYDLITRIKTWAEKYPADVFSAHCDDDHFTNSDIFYILHRASDDWMGVSVVFVPQCAPGDPSIHFLYPSHMANVAIALKTIKGEMDKHPDAKAEYNQRVRAHARPR